MSFLEIEYREQNKVFNMADLQTHDFYEIYYLQKGERNIFIEDKIFTMRENSIVVIPPFNMHKTEGGPYKRLNLYVSTDLLDERETEFLNYCASFESFRLDKATTNVFLSIFRPFFSGGGKEDTLLKKYSQTFLKSFLYLLQSSTLIPTENNSPLAKGEEDGRKIILDIVAYINNHFREEITLGLLQNKFFISKNTLCKKFSEVMRCSVIEYASAVRLNEAKYLLSTTNKGIEEVAELCGYSSANYFSLIFKAKTGVSPSNYRKKS